MQMGHTPLFSACMGGHPDVVKLLLEHGASVKVTDQVSVKIMYGLGFSRVKFTVARMYKTHM